MPGAQTLLIDLWPPMSSFANSLRRKKTKTKRTVMKMTMRPTKTTTDTRSEGAPSSRIRMAVYVVV